jgi:hypothetical protein
MQENQSQLYPRGSYDPSPQLEYRQVEPPTPLPQPTIPNIFSFDR